MQWSLVRRRRACRGCASRARGRRRCHLARARYAHTAPAGASTRNRSPAARVWRLASVLRRDHHRSQRLDDQRSHRLDRRRAGVIADQSVHQVVGAPVDRAGGRHAEVGRGPAGRDPAPWWRNRPGRCAAPVAPVTASRRPAGTGRHGPGAAGPAVRVGVPQRAWSCARSDTSRPATPTGTRRCSPQRRRSNRPAPRCAAWPGGERAGVGRCHADSRNRG